MASIKMPVDKIHFNGLYKLDEIMLILGEFYGYKDIRDYVCKSVRVVKRSK